MILLENTFTKTTPITIKNNPKISDTRYFNNNFNGGYYSNFLIIKLL